MAACTCDSFSSSGAATTLTVQNTGTGKSLYVSQINADVHAIDALSNAASSMAVCATNTNNSGVAIKGNSVNGHAIWGNSTGSGSGVRGIGAGTGHGVNGLAAGASAHGVYGSTSNAATTAHGVCGTTSGGGYGVCGTTSGAGAGVYGSTSNTGNGILGECTNGTSGAGVKGTASGSSTTASIGVYGAHSHATNGIGVKGYAVGTSSYGVHGQSTGSSSSGVYGTSPYAGVQGSGTGASGAGILGVGSGGAYAGFFSGNVSITGNLAVSGSVSKSSGSFSIPHPFDESKMLNHSFVESPEMLNLYRGTVVMGDDGTATVELPSYFEAINIDFSYTLTAVGAPAPNLHVSKEIENLKFEVAGGVPGKKVCWIVAGVRNDEMSKKHPVLVETDKAPEFVLRPHNHLALDVKDESGV